MAHIAVIHHEFDPVATRPYLIGQIADRWRAAGHRVSQLRGMAEFVPADVALLHVDLTRVPSAYLAFARRYPRVLNGAAPDIAKRRFSTHLVGIGDRDTGPVMLKTDRNHAGIPERDVARARAERHGRWAVRARRLAESAMPWWLAGRLESNAYPVYRRAGEIPILARLNPRFVVQRFLPERRGALYVTRRWTFLGRAEFGCLILARSPDDLGTSIVGRERIAAVPPELRAMRQRLGLDYGKFDYVMLDGAPVLFDANKTMGGMWQDNVLAPAMIATLAEGIDGLA